MKGMRITLKAARINRNLTQEVVATELCVTKKTVSSWENGRTLPAVDKIEQICNLYGLSYDDIQWNL